MTTRFRSGSPRDIRMLQSLLNANLHLRSPLFITGRFDANTLAALKAYQRVNGFKETNLVSTDLWRTLNEHPHAKILYDYRVGPQEPLADIAIKYIGATETRPNLIGNDPKMKEIFEADNLAPAGRTDGYPWCCALVSLCVQKLIASSPMYKTIKPPRESSVQRFRTIWAPGQGCLVFPPNDKTFAFHRGDVVVYTFSHIGIVDGSRGPGILDAIEGNTNKQGSREGTICMRKTRILAQVRCFIRLPVRLDYDERGQQCLTGTGPNMSIDEFLRSL